MMQQKYTVIVRLYRGSMSGHCYIAFLPCLYRTEQTADRKQSRKKREGSEKTTSRDLILGQKKKGFAQTLLSQLTFCQIRVASANHFSDLHMPTIDIERDMEEAYTLMFGPPSILNIWLHPRIFMLIHSNL